MSRNLHRNSSLGPSTRAIHGGETPHEGHRSSVPDISMSCTHLMEGPAGFSAHDLTEDSPFLYGRWANPTVRMFEEKLAGLEGTESAAAYASGMAAASAIFSTFLSAGDHVIVSDVCYAGVSELARDTLPRFGITVSRVNMSDLDAVQAAITPQTRLIHAESPANPLIRLTDLAAVARIAHGAGALLSCDATFASPLGQRAADLGVDLIMHSATKYIGGHGDAMGGVVAGKAELIRKMTIEATVHGGGIMAPMNAWLIARGMATLPLRMKAHEAGALAIGAFLEDHPAVTRVLHPGLASHPQADLARSQMQNTGGMLSFQVGDRAKGEAVAQKMVERLQIIHYAVSLGHTRSLIVWMGTEDLFASSFPLQGAGAAAYRDFAGDGLFRLSVGLEDAEDLIADLDAVL